MCVCARVRLFVFWQEGIYQSLDAEQQIQIAEILLQSIQRIFGSAALLRAGSCCKFWREVSLDPSMWTVVRCGHECTLNEDALNYMCARSRGALDILDIKCRPGIKMYSFVKAVQFNPGLQEVCVSCFCATMFACTYARVRGVSNVLDSMCGPSSEHIFLCE